MKICEDFIKMRALESWIIVPVGETAKRNNFILRLNDTGSEIWDGFKAGKSNAEIAAMLCASYEITEQEAEKNIADFIQQMKNCGAFSQE